MTENTEIYIRSVKKVLVEQIAKQDIKDMHMLVLLNMFDGVLKQIEEFEKESKDVKQITG